VDLEQGGWGVEGKPPLTFGSLFAGIGGFDLGFERAGMKPVWQVEIDKTATEILSMEWPNVRRHDDVRTFPPGPNGEWYADVICGGFPCQDISFAGFGSGLEGGRSSLFYQAMRIVRDLGPKFVVLENVAALLDRGMGEVLGTLAALGFDAEWGCLPASAFGLFHNRDRVFICAYRSGSVPGVFAKSRGKWRRQFQHRRLVGNSLIAQWPGKRLPAEPKVAPLVHGIPNSVGRYGIGKGLGNAVVPQVAEWIGRRIVEACN
jgi:DNA (cytosine-5)-methyltransferase 1